MAEEIGGKQASETIELLKLFQQVGRSFFGLLLIEIAWTVFLVLATKLTGSDHGTPAIGKFSFIRLWVYGALVLAVFWGFYSRLVYYIVSPFIIVLKLFSDAFFVIAAMTLIILDALLTPIVRPIHKALVRRQFRLDKAAWIVKNAGAAAAAEADAIYDAWLQSEKQRIGAGMRIDKDEWIAKFKREQSGLGHAVADPEAAFSAWKPDAQRQYAESILEGIAKDKAFLKENNLERLVQTMGRTFLTPLHSGLVVGVASLVKYSDGTDLIVDHTPLKQLGDAMAATRVRLSHLKGIGYIELRPLPSLFRIETPGRALFARSFFKLDALIWGRYTHQEQRLAQAHIVVAGPTRLKDDDNIGFQYQRAIFPRDIDHDFFADVSSFTFAVDDPVDAHIVMCVGLLRALVRRHEKGPPRFLSGWDKSYHSSRVDARRILLHFAFDVLPLVRAENATGQVLPTASTVLADIISRWAGYQIGSSFRWDDEDKVIIENTELFVPQLHGIVTRCARLTPENTAHYYRLGALSCIIGKPDRALEEFRHAAILERDNGRVRPILAAVEAQMTLLVGSSQKEELVLARFAAHAACAVFIGAGHLVREDMQKSEMISLRTIDPNNVHPTIALVQKLLTETNNQEPWRPPQIPAAITS